MTKAETILRIELSKQVINPLFSDTKEVAVITKEIEGKVFVQTLDLTNEMDYSLYRVCKNILKMQNKNN